MAQKILRPRPWDENCGVLRQVVVDEPFTFLDFGWFRVKISSTEIASIREQLEQAIGKRISLLKTDIPEKSLLMRIVGDD
jgi:predicted transcriptional regulator